MDSQTWSMIFVIAVLVIGALILFAYFSRVKCPRCKKRNCNRISSREARTENISIKKTETIKHYSKEQTGWGGGIKLGEGFKPESVSTREYTVPGIRTYYDVTYSCLMCGEQFSQREYRDSEA